MACTELMAFKYATENLSTILHQSISSGSIWFNLPQKGVLPQGQGTNFTNFGFHNIEPYAAPTAWTALNMSEYARDSELTGGIDHDLELCTTDWQDVYSGWVAIDYHPEIRQLRGEQICEKQLQFIHNKDAFIRAYIDKMTIRARREWEMIYAYWHRYYSMKAVVLADFVGNFKQQAALTGLSEATGTLTQEALDFVADYLIDAGAHKPDQNGYITETDNAPVFTLGVSRMMSNLIGKENDNIRNDVRYADPNMLMARLGSRKSMGNYVHMINQWPARYTFADGTYTEVPRYVRSDDASVDTWETNFVSSGYGYPTNPAWSSAPFEAADVLSPYLFESLTPSAVTSSNGLQFGPNNYMGDWRFIVGSYKWGESCSTGANAGDPLDEKGRHFAQFIQAASPNPMARWTYGFHIIYKRCLGNSVAQTTCSS